MKSLHLNLASTPYRDYRAVYAVAALMAVISGILLIYNAQTAYSYWVDTQATRGTIAEMEQEAARERQTTESLEKRLASIDTKGLNEEAVYVNTQIAERAFSWSKLLDRLERVMPRDVRLTSLNPSINKDGEISLDMVCVAKTSDGMVRLITRMIEDPSFDKPFPRSENQNEDGTYTFTLGVAYTPADRLVLPQQARAAGAPR